MGDLAELKGLILVISFLSCFFILVGFIPASLFQSEQAQKMIDLDIPEVYRAYEIVWLNYSEIEYINSSEANHALTNHWKEFNIGGWDVQLRWIIDPTFNEYRMMVWHETKWWIFITDTHGMKWINQSGFIVSDPWEGDDNDHVCWVNKIVNCFDENGFAKFRVQCDHFGMDLILKYDTTKYPNFFEAFKNNDFHACFGIEPSELNTKLSAWDLIGRLLFFQMPEVHPVINMLIAIPIWTCVAYLVYVLILKAIPFTGG